MAEQTYALSIEDVEFVVWHLPQDDGFTVEMHRWLNEQHQRIEEEEERKAHGPGVVFRFGANGLPRLSVEPAPPGGWTR